MLPNFQSTKKLLAFLFLNKECWNFKNLSIKLKTFSFVPMRKALAFSLIELMISLIVISTITAAFTPVITKKLKSSGVTMGGLSTNPFDGMVFGEDRCKDILTGTINAITPPASCSFCNEIKRECVSCNDVFCSSSQFKYKANCSCKNCSEKYGIDCVQCDDKKCSACIAGYYLEGSGTSASCKEVSSFPGCDSNQCYTDPEGVPPVTKPTVCPEGAICNNGIKTECTTPELTHKLCSGGAASDCPVGKKCSEGKEEPCGAHKLCSGGVESDCPNGMKCDNGIASTCSLNKLCSNGAESDCPNGKKCTNGIEENCTNGKKCIGGIEYPCAANKKCSNGIEENCALYKKCTNGIEYPCGTNKKCNGGVEYPCGTNKKCSNGIEESCGNYKLCTDGVEQDCPNGKKCSGGKEQACTANKLCSNGVESNCPEGKKCIGGVEQPCDPNKLCTGGIQKDCPTGNTCVDGFSSVCSVSGKLCENGVAVNCPEGYYCENGKSNNCGAGYYCPEGSGLNTKRQKCPEGTYSTNASLASVSGCLYCADGTWSQAGSSSCSSSLCETGYTCSKGNKTKNCSVANCKTCALNSTTVCNTCDTNYTLESGNCRLKTNCDNIAQNLGLISNGISLLYQIGNYCVMRCNVGDCGFSKSDTCYASSSSGCTPTQTGVTETFSYSGCKRTLCNWATADTICKNYNTSMPVSGYTWRLPSTSEFSQWKNYVKADKLHLCDWDSSNNGSVRCQSGGSSYPATLWSNSNGYYYYLSKNNWNQDYHLNYTSYGFSVRCVLVKN